jgi:ubiquitin-conjugating enzyme E2 variant
MMPAHSPGDSAHPERLGWQSLMEWVAIVVASALWLFLAARLVRSDGLRASLWWVTGLGAAVGYLAGDLMSGVVHWFCDTFFEEHSPVIGRVLIHPFREHHRDPLAMTRHDFAEIAGNSCLALAPGLGIVALLPAPTRPLWLGAYAALLVFTVVAVVTNQLHKWAHMPAVPGYVAAMQRTGLILRPPRHAAHHRTQAEAYCVATGWLNPFLDRIGFFPAVERALVALRLPMSDTAPRWAPLQRRKGPRREKGPLGEKGPHGENG